MADKEFPPMERLLEAMSFCPLSGNAYWKQRPEHHFPKGWSSTWNKRYSGKKAGTISAYQYLRCAFDKSVYPIHRLMWYVHNGGIPAGYEIDHINGNRQDNRLKNLRLVTDHQNAMNKGMSKRNTSGITGVYWHVTRKKWMAKIRVNDKLLSLGQYSKKDEAISARKQAEETYFGKFKRQENG